MSRPAALLQIKDARLTLGGAPLFTGVDLALARGDRAALVGRNGAGKSTLLRILAGDLEPDAGDVARASGLTLGVVAQEPDLSGWATLGAYAAAPFGAGPPAPDHAAAAALQAWGLDPARSAEGLSGGETRRAALARAFAHEPDVLLLDEPTNHLDIPAIEALEARLAAYSGAVLVISHDRRFLERASTCCFWLRQGVVRRLDRGYAAFDAWAQGIEDEETRTLARMETHLRAEEHWLRRGVTARRARNEGRRSRLVELRAARRALMAARAKSVAAIEAETGGESGRVVIEARGLSKTWPGATAPTVADLSLKIMRGDRVGIVGPNGAGKTTLIDLLLGRISPDGGIVRHGTNLEIAYLDQTRAGLRGAETMQEALCPLGGDQVMVRGKARHVAAYARDFAFGPQHLRQPVSALSGGERNRLLLAVALAKPANLLVLDEPTNDLDMDTLDALEEALDTYEGTVLVVSHDRAFLDDVATQVIGAVGGGRWAESPGGYADFEREHGGWRAPAPRPAANRPPPPAAAPKKPRKLSYRDERRLGEIEALLPRLAAEIARLEATLADPGLYARDAKRFAEASALLDKSRADKDAAETEWLEIEARREALASDADD
ncbi:MAG: ATP-binding cassette domain-containing protein [Alphaproteobacteria bacterium]|nr:ATP-binding cassette domain-containing protein [Alphaproteobacteria bacterium]